MNLKKNIVKEKILFVTTKNLFYFKIKQRICYEELKNKQLIKNKPNENYEINIDQIDKNDLMDIMKNVIILNKQFSGK